MMQWLDAHINHDPPDITPTNAVLTAKTIIFITKPEKALDHLTIHVLKIIISTIINCILTAWPNAKFCP